MAPSCPRAFLHLSRRRRPSESATKSARVPRSRFSAASAASRRAEKPSVEGARGTARRLYKRWCAATKRARRCVTSAVGAQRHVLHLVGMTHWLLRMVFIIFPLTRGLPRGGASRTRRGLSNDLSSVGSSTISCDTTHESVHHRRAVRYM